LKFSTSLPEAYPSIFWFIDNPIINNKTIKAVFSGFMIEINEM
jgi:hypothetical protein